MASESGLEEGGQERLPATVAVNGAQLSVWPEAQATQNADVMQIAVTRFADVAIYHPSLIEATLAGARDLRFHDPAHLLIRAGCGAKVRNIQDWDVPAAALVHARAMLLAQQALAQQGVFADDTWASIYANGDYCMPHGHTRADVSIVYMLDPGDGDPSDAFAGQLCFIDPRIEWCCPLEPGRVTRPLMPRMSAGTMIVFAGAYVHTVMPYRGTRPRITMSWNITRERLAGRPRDR
jgi:Putative 2OG-Fe(II) oxygenase